MSDDLDAVCDEVWHGTNGDDLLVCSGCPGCHYVAGAAAFGGLLAMASILHENEKWRCPYCRGLWTHADGCRMLKSLDVDAYYDDNCDASTPRGG